MGFFSGVKKVFGVMFGSDTIITTGMEILDKASFTDQEKAENQIEFMKTYAAFKVAQRFLSIIFSIPYVLAWLITFIASFYINVDFQLELLRGDMGNIVFAICGFYFFGGAAEGAIAAIKKRRA